MSDRAYLGFSFRWVYQMPDQGIVYDSFGRPHSGIFVFNSGTAPALGVRFRGILALLKADPSRERIDTMLRDRAWSVPTDCHPGLPPLFYQLDGVLQVGAGVDEIYAFGQADSESQSTAQFCVHWTGSAWENVAV